jgi:hypothetical protein
MQDAWLPPRTRLQVPSTDRRLLLHLDRHVARERRQCGILNWGFSNNWSGPKVFFWCGCEHGQGKIGRTWMLEAVGSIEGWHSPTTMDMNSEDEPLMQIVIGLPRRTFHPEPEFWTDAQ